MRRPVTYVVCVAFALLLFTPALASAKTFYVHPSQSGNDTTNIQSAFNAAAKAPGSTVQLSAGHFYTDTVLVKDFNGTFKGAGQGKTVVDCLRGFDPNLPGVTVKPGIAYFPFLLGFEGGRVSTSDMTFAITAASPAEPWDNGGSPADYLLASVLVTDNASCAFEHVGFTAGSGSDSGFDCDIGICVTGYAPLDANGAPVALGQTSGTESVAGCSFVGHDGVQVNGLTKGTLSVCGSTFDDWFTCCFVDDSSASQIAISHNQMLCAQGDDVIIDQGWEAGFGGGAPLPPRPAPTFLVSDNHIVATGNAGGVYVEDDSPLYGAPNRLNATITGNNLSLDNGGVEGGIDGLYAKGIVVCGNRISGTALAGIDVGAAESLWGMPSAPASGWQIIGNDVSGLTATGDQYGVQTAQIWLGADASNCLVVGGKAPTTVLDQGTNDTLVNVTPVTASLSARALSRTRGAVVKAGLMMYLH